VLSLTKFRREAKFQRPRRLSTKRIVTESGPNYVGISAPFKTPVSAALLYLFRDQFAI